MDDSTTILFLIKDKYPFLDRTIKLINDYVVKYRNISQIVFADNNSTDGSYNHLLGRGFFIIKNDNNLCEKDFLIIVLEQISTNNVILLDVELYTRLHQVQRQIKKLHRCNLLITNRFHKDSLTKFKNSYEKIRVLWNNIFIMLLTGLNYSDTININKAFRKDKILPLMKLCSNRNYYWQETIKLCQKKGISITEVKTHYVESEHKTTDKLFKLLLSIKELMRIRKK
jgi:hypothetical protein